MSTPLRLVSAALATLFLSLSRAHAEVKVTVQHLSGARRAPVTFAIPGVPTPRGDDLAARANAGVTLVDGEPDRNGGGVNRLTDGKLPKNSDDPGANFFFAPNTDGGRFLLDLGSVTDVKQINTYSWHSGSRGPQVYQVYGSDGQAAGFAQNPKRPADPARAGWKLIAAVDTRPQGRGSDDDDKAGGQYGVSIADTDTTKGSLGQFRYLLFDVRRTEDRDPFGNTFYSEIDVFDKITEPNPGDASASEAAQIVKSAQLEDGTRFTVETTEAPDLTDWAQKDLIPVMEKWYPILVKMLPSEGFTAPRRFSVNFTNEYQGVAATIGTRVLCSTPWYRQNLKGEGIGSVIHELVHVIQQYWSTARSANQRPPSWLVEGLCDYIRWYLYEPQSHGADLTPTQANDPRIKYDGSYRITANFLHFVITKYDKDLIKELNAAMREGRYTPEFWKIRTGKSVEDLAAEWKKSIEAGEAMTKKS